MYFTARIMVNFIGMDVISCSRYTNYNSKLENNKNLLYHIDSPIIHIFFNGL
jgi:hypothetical protein